MIENDFKKQFNERVNLLINTMLFDIEKQINIGEKIPWATVTKIEKLLSMKYSDTQDDDKKLEELIDFKITQQFTRYLRDAKWRLDIDKYVENIVHKKIHDIASLDAADFFSLVKEKVTEHEKLIGEINE